MIGYKRNYWNIYFFRDIGKDALPKDESLCHATREMIIGYIQQIQGLFT